MYKYNKYLGIPFKSGGRDFDGIDCYSLIQLFYKNELNIDLPSYYEDAFNTEAVSAIMNEEKKKWIELKEPELYCVVFLRFNCMYGNHVGIYLGNGDFLHARQKTGSCITNINNPAWKKNIIGYYKYKL